MQVYFRDQAGGDHAQGRCVHSQQQERRRRRRRREHTPLPLTICFICAAAVAAWGAEAKLRSCGRPPARWAEARPTTALSRSTMRSFMSGGLASAKEEVEWSQGEGVTINCRRNGLRLPVRAGGHGCCACFPPSCRMCLLKPNSPCMLPSIQGRPRYSGNIRVYSLCAFLMLDKWMGGPGCPANLPPGTSARCCPPLLVPAHSCQSGRLPTA